jgi:putative proteasome-type protease
MTYCVGVLLNDGVVLASDSRTHAGVDNIAQFCKMTVFERPGDRVIILLSSGNLAGTQAVISVLKQRGDSPDGSTTIWNAVTLFDVARIVTDAVREVERRDGAPLANSPHPFNASFIIGGQIAGEPPRLFRTFAEGNFIEAGTDTTFFQTGETKYGKPIIDRVITPSTSLADAMKCILVSFDSTMRSNLSVGMPIDLAFYVRDSLRLGTRHRFEQDDAYFRELGKQWRDGVREVFRRLPAVPARQPLN